MLFDTVTLRYFNESLGFFNKVIFVIFAKLRWHLYYWSWYSVEMVTVTGHWAWAATLGAVSALAVACQQLSTHLYFQHLTRGSEAEIKKASSEIKCGRDFRNQSHLMWILFTLHGWWFFILFMLVLDGMYWHYFFICNFQIFHLICLLNLRICHSKLQILLIPICNRRKTIQDKCFPLFGTCKMRLQFELNSWISQNITAALCRDRMLYFSKQ